MTVALILALAAVTAFACWLGRVLRENAASRARGFDIFFRGDDR